MITLYELYLTGAAVTYAASLVITEHEKPDLGSWTRVLASFAMAVVWPFTTGFLLGNAYITLHSK